VSRPAKASSLAVREALMAMKPTKVIRLELGSSFKTIGNQVAMMGLQRVYLTREERLMIAKHRKLNPSTIP
jgi:hypothetical protein